MAKTALDCARAWLRKQSPNSITDVLKADEREYTGLIRYVQPWKKKLIEVRVDKRRTPFDAAYDVLMLMKRRRKIPRNTKLTKYYNHVPHAEVLKNLLGRPLTFDGGIVD